MGCCMACYYKPEEYKQMKYSRIRNSLKTGDIILFSNNATSSNIVKIATLSPFSHIGMIIKTDGRLYLWHSVNEKITFTKDVITKTYKKGVQLNDLDDMIEHSDGGIYIRRSNIKTDKDLFKLNLKTFFEPFAKKDYERDYIEMVNAAFDDAFTNEDTPKTTETIFCSELNAYTYKKFGWSSSDNIACCEYVPSDFSTGGTFHFFADSTYFYFKKNITFETEIEIIK